MIDSIEGISGFGTILGIWAHPDDEVFSMGGIMAAASKNGQKIICVTATRGEAGVQDESRWPAHKLGQIRTEELEEAYKILGIRDHVWLDYPDGGCADINEGEAASRIAEVIREYSPDSIFTFGPDGLTGHKDHQTVSRWSDIAHGMAGTSATIYHAIQTKSQYDAMLEADRELNIFFNIDIPLLANPQDCDCCVELTDELYGLKIEALRAMPSQTEKMLKMFEVNLRAGLGWEAFVKAG